MFKKKLRRNQNYWELLLYLGIGRQFDRRMKLSGGHKRRYDGQWPLTGSYFKRYKGIARIEVNLNKLCQTYPDNHEQRFLEIQNKVKDYKENLKKGDQKCGTIRDRM